MCLIALAWRAHPALELVLVGNRDEWHARPTAPAGWDGRAPSVLGGRDLLAGGSWLEFSPRGRMATVTNVRCAPAEPARPRSRGQLVSEYLRDDRPWPLQAADWSAHGGEYGRYNLVAWDGHALYYAGNHPRWHQRRLVPGLYALSNADIDSDWPKVQRARVLLRDWLRGIDNDVEERACAMLLQGFADRERAADADLPDTGIGLERERLLSPLFIAGEAYGTRSTSLLLWSRDRRWCFIERRYGPDGLVLGEQCWRGTGEHLQAGPPPD